MEEKLKKLLEDARSSGADSGKAFEELLNIYEPLIASSVASFSRSTGGEKDDLSQEARIAFYNSIKTYDLESEKVTFGLYAKVCLTNRLISIARKSKSRLEKEKSKAKSEELERAKTPFSASESLFDKEEVFGLLTPLEKSVLNYRLSGLSYGECAKRLGRSKKCIDNALVRIKKKSKKIRNK